MANISSTFGNACIYAESADKAEKICNAINTVTSEFGYYTEFDIDENGKNISEKNYSCSFQACGRWSYETNLENFGSWLDSSREKHLEIIEMLEKEDFRIILDFTDEECGCQFIYTACAELIHKANTPIKDTEFNMLEKIFYDYTRKNLKVLCGYDDDYINDMFYEDEAC